MSTLSEHNLDIGLFLLAIFVHLICLNISFKLVFEACGDSVFHLTIEYYLL